MFPSVTYLSEDDLHSGNEAICATRLHNFCSHPVDLLERILHLDTDRRICFECSIPFFHWWARLLNASKTFTFFCYESHLIFVMQTEPLRIDAARESINASKSLIVAALVQYSCVILVFK